MGERFPENDPSKLPVLDPMPSSRKDFLHGILQAIAIVEKNGYNALVELGIHQTPSTFS